MTGSLQLRNRHLFLLDMVALLSTPFLALVLRTESVSNLGCYFDGNSGSRCYFEGLVAYTLLSLSVRVLVFYLFGLYSRYWRYASVDDMVQIAYAVAISTAVILPMFILLRSLIPALNLPRSVPLIDALLVFLWVSGSRFSLRFVVRRRKQAKLPNAITAVVMGAGDAGSMIMRELQNSPHLNVHPIGFLDDDPGKHNMRIHGLPVLGGREAIPGVADRYDLDQIIIAMPTASGKTIREIVRICEAAGVQPKTIPGIYELLDGSATISQLRDVAIEDLLRREPVQTDTRGVHNLLRGKRVLVTGGGGSIGSELCRQILACEPARLVVLGRGENAIFDIARELRLQNQAGRKQTEFKAVIADVRNDARMQQLFAKHKPQVVFHAAAHKHVPLMESNPAEAVTNNILGTQNLLQAAQAHGVERFVMISTDKAVNPSSVMGASKRTAEMLVLETAAQSKRPYVVVRFGNVLGSRGSVVLTFQQQIARGGPVTVTDPEMTRYFMTIPEAVQLVLQATELGAGGEVFVLDMGEPVKIVDLACDLIELSGLKVGRDIDIEYIGRRPGEKLHEELFVPGEQYHRTQHEMIFVAGNGDTSSAKVPEQLSAIVAALAEAAQANDEAAIRKLFIALIPGYQPAPAPALRQAQSEFETHEPVVKVAPSVQQAG